MLPFVWFDWNGTDRTVSWRAVSTVRLTPTSYVVLGLVEAQAPATPYELKQTAQVSIANFWPVPHTQLYSECSRLAEAGLLDEHQETSGRRRRVYEMTTAGTSALDEWRAGVDDEMPLAEVRDLATLKLFFGADPAALAPGQIAAHEAKLAEYEEIAAMDLPEGMRLALECGIGHEREFIRFWEGVRG